MYIEYQIISYKYSQETSYLILKIFSSNQNYCFDVVEKNKSK